MRRVVALLALAVLAVAAAAWLSRSSAEECVHDVRWVEDDDGFAVGV